MVYIADVSSTGVQHEQFNLSFLRLFQQTFPNEKSTFFSHESHGKLLIKKIEHTDFEAIEVYESRGGYKEFIRAYHQFQALLKILGRAEKQQANRLIILLIHPFAHFLLKQFSSSPVEIVIVTHGELESLKFNKHFVNKIWGWFLKRAMTIYSAKVKYIILGQSIYDTLIKVLPDFARQRAVVLDHPYPFEDHSSRLKQPGKIVLSSLGVATISKSTQYFFQVAEKAAKMGLNRLSFHICGRVYRNMEPYINNHVTFKQNFEALTRDELDTIMAKSDFAVFYYDNKHYSLCSSGAFWDAVNAEIPLLYLHNDYFDYYASVAGEIGIAFDTTEELNEYVLHLGQSDFDEAHYQQFVTNIKRLKNEIMSTDHLSSQLRKLN